MTKDGYTMKGDSRGGQLIRTSPSDGSRLVVDVMSYRNRRAGRTADCKKRFVEEADMDSRKADWHQPLRWQQACG